MGVMESSPSLKFFPFLKSKPLISPVGLSGVALLPQRTLRKMRQVVTPSSSLTTWGWHKVPQCCHGCAVVSQTKCLLSRGKLLLFFFAAEVRGYSFHQPCVYPCSLFFVFFARSWTLPQPTRARWQHFWELQLSGVKSEMWNFGLVRKDDECNDDEVDSLFEKSCSAPLPDSEWKQCPCPPVDPQW